MTSTHHISQTTQKGQILIILLLFGLILGGLYSLEKKPNQAAIKIGSISNSACKPSSEIATASQITLPSVDQKGGGKADEVSNPGGDGWDSAKNTTYRIIRSSIKLNADFFESPHSQSVHSKFYQDLSCAGAGKCRVYYPLSSGELVFGDTPKPQFRVDLRHESILIFVHLDQSGNPITGVVPKSQSKRIDIQQDPNRTDLKYYVVDLYQKSDVPDNLPPSAFCDTHSATSTSIPESDGLQPGPNQKISPDKKQLQLEYFVFNTPNSPQSTTVYDYHCKPAIYLYPSSPQLINVKVNTKGYLTYTDPPYPKDNGWTVLASPDGRLYTLNNKLITNNYLYYESKIPDQLINKPQNGSILEYGNLTNYLQYLLPKLALNPTQTQDFISYWTKALPFAPFYFVGVLDQKNINDFEPLQITPKPDYLNRVRVYFKALSEKPAEGLFVPELPTNLSPLTSSAHLGVVEWGGMIKLDPNHPFTCSQ